MQALRSSVKNTLNWINIYRVNSHCYKYLKRYSALVNIRPLAQEEKQNAKLFYNNFNIKIKTEWHEFYASINEKFYANYIPEDLYLSRIEKALNRFDFIPALTDKNILEVILPHARIANTIIMNINGSYYDHQRKPITKRNAIDLSSAKKDVIIKPSLDSGGGRNVQFITDNSIAKTESYFEQYKNDFIVQEPIIQHCDMASLNPTSVNTIRLITYLDQSGNVRILPSMIRFGGKGSVLDNATTGGWFCGIEKSGKLRKKAYNRKYESITEINDVVFENFYIPNYSRLIATVDSLHKSLPYFKLISWDFAINEAGEFICVELNVKDQGTKEVQIVNGKPLFGKYTEEVLQFSLRTEKK